MGGISANTGNNIVYGTDGYVTVNNVDIGATEDAIEVEWSANQYYPNLAQARGPVSGTGRVVEADFKIKVKLSEWQYSVLSTLLGSFTVSSNANSQRIGGGAIGTVTEVTNVVVTGITRNDNKAFRATIPTAYVVVGNISFAEDKETTLEITFNGLYTLSSPRSFPGYFEIQV